MPASNEEFRPTESAEIVPLNNDWIVTNLTIGTVAVILVTALAQRRLVVVKNLSMANTFFFSDVSCVAASGAKRGLEVPPDSESLPFLLGPDVRLVGIADGLNTEVQVLEAA